MAVISLSSVTALCGDATMAATDITSQGSDVTLFTVTEESDNSTTAATKATHQALKSPV
ncbi:hypothetical protein OOK27_06890 [Streptomyces canus]|uniref:hypothetical protein n=1 Tax=Streptomyces canus TaxID=58343 RepID=UPI0022515BF8|nr:hypothetical protein [Streptomyces canus]MCX5253899.1 hypothetical protein [Streptomyces canus]